MRNTNATPPSSIRQPKPKGGRRLGERERPQSKLNLANDERMDGWMDGWTDRCERRSRMSRNRTELCSSLSDSLRLTEGAWRGTPSRTSSRSLSLPLQESRMQSVKLAQHECNFLIIASRALRVRPLSIVNAIMYSQHFLKWGTLSPLSSFSFPAFQPRVRVLVAV